MSVTPITNVLPWEWMALPPKLFSVTRPGICGLVLCKAFYVILFSYSWIITHALDKRIKIFCDNKSPLDWTMHNSYRRTDSWIRAKIKCTITLTSGTVSVDFVNNPFHTEIEWNEVANVMPSEAPFLPLWMSPANSFNSLCP